MSTYCHELNHKIKYGDPFYIITKEGINGGAIVSNEAMVKVPEASRISSQDLQGKGIAVYKAISSYSMGDTYSWFDIKKGEFLFSLDDDDFSRFFPNSKLLLES